MVMSDPLFAGKMLKRSFHYGGEWLLRLVSKRLTKLVRIDGDKALSVVTVTCPVLMNVDFRRIVQSHLVPYFK